MDPNDVNPVLQQLQQNLRRDLQIVNPVTGKTETLVLGTETLTTDVATGNSLQRTSVILVRTRDGQLLDLNTHRFYACTQCDTSTFLSEQAVVFCQDCGTALCRSRCYRRSRGMPRCRRCRGWEWVVWLFKV